MFKKIYELICGENVDPTYATDVYPSVGLFTFIFALVFCIVFYLVFGRWKPILDKLAHWVIALLILDGISLAFALFQAKAAIGADTFDPFMIKFAMVNSLYSSIYFILLSLLFQRFSIFARHLPFKL